MGKILGILFALIIIIVLVASGDFPLWGNALLIVAGLAFIGSLFFKK